MSAVTVHYGHRPVPPTDFGTGHANPHVASANPIESERRTSPSEIRPIDRNSEAEARSRRIGLIIMGILIAAIFLPPVIGSIVASPAAFFFGKGGLELALMIHVVILGCMVATPIVICYSAYSACSKVRLAEPRQ